MALEGTETVQIIPAGRTRVGLDLLRKRFVRRPWLFEVTLFALALVFYQVSRALVVGEPWRAFRNAWGLIRWEKATGIFVETNIQEFFLDHLRLISILNYFYISAHWIVTTLFFVWLYKSRPRVYPHVRNAFFAANAVALAVFVVFPVAPPRLMPGPGFIDTLQQVSGINLHAGSLASLFNPYAAVPSMHFGYAFMVGVVAAFLVHSWPLKALALTYPAVVFVTITGTANHYVLDSVGGALSILLGFAAVAAWHSARAGRSLSLAEHGAS
jgi:PAP2 superfamily